MMLAHCSGSRYLGLKGVVSRQPNVWSDQSPLNSSWTAGILILKTEEEKFGMERSKFETRSLLYLNASAPFLCHLQVYFKNLERGEKAKCFFLLNNSTLFTLLPPQQTWLKLFVVSERAGSLTSDRGVGHVPWGDICSPSRSGGLHTLGQPLSRVRLGPWPFGALGSVDRKCQMVIQIDEEWLRCRIEGASHSCSDGGGFRGSRVKLTAGWRAGILVAWTIVGSSSSGVAHVGSSIQRPQWRVGCGMF